VQCTLCPRSCIVEPGKRGHCGVRENQEGEYVTLVYGNPCAVHVDPVEKKPFFHLLPGAQAFSFATAGCNFSCKFCQNWEISQSSPEHIHSIPLSPVQAVKEARTQGASLLVGTYSEPTIFYEYMVEMAREARKGGLKAAVVSNGFIKSEPLKELCKVVDAIKIDLKSFRDEFYQKICSGSLAPVLESLRTIKQRGTWLEIVYLVVPTLNDSLEEIKEMSLWIKKELGSDVPLHFSRFHPMYKLTHLPATPVDTLKKACDTARKAGLRYVYLGNLPGDRGESTYCPHCGGMVIERFAFTIKRNLLKGGKCPLCGTTVPGLWH
jgi:pyruvate formate lyase activating enzyme